MPTLRSPRLPSDPGPELDEVTLARARTGDLSAQAALVIRYESAVKTLLWRMLGPDRALVEDVTQETFLRVLRALPGFSSGGRARLVTWIVTIATRQAIDHLRKRSRQMVAGALEGLQVVLPRPDQVVDRRALAIALMRAIAALGPPLQAAFVLRELHGLSYEEIAETLEVDVGTVKSRLYRARAMLQASLAPARDA